MWEKADKGGSRLNWKKEAIEDLRSYNDRKKSLDNMKAKITALELQYRTIRSSSADSTPVQGGASRTEDSWINNIVQRDRLRLTYQATKPLVALVERGLAGLTEQQREVLDSFYINHISGHVRRLSEKYHIEQAQVYRMKDEALRQFTINMYGLIDY